MPTSESTGSLLWFGPVTLLRRNVVSLVETRSYWLSFPVFASKWSGRGNLVVRPLKLDMHTNLGHLVLAYWSVLGR